MLSQPTSSDVSFANKKSNNPFMTVTPSAFFN